MPSISVVPPQACHRRASCDVRPRAPLSVIAARVSAGEWGRIQRIVVICGLSTVAGGSRVVDVAHRACRKDWRVAHVAHPHGVLALPLCFLARRVGINPGMSSAADKSCGRRRLCVCSRVHQNNADRPVDLVKVRCTTQHSTPWGGKDLTCLGRL